MKLYTIKKYAAILLCLAAFTSCDTDAEGTKYGVNGVEAAFASTQMNVEVGAEDNGVIQVPVYRGNTDAEASVGISMDEATVEEGVFTLKSSNIAFAKGEAVGYAELVFGSINDLSATGKYIITLAIDDKDALSPYQIRRDNSDRSEKVNMGGLRNRNIYFRAFRSGMGTAYIES